MPFSFVLTGGGTGGHVFPALAVGRVLRDRGHRLLFIGTREGLESRLVPEAHFDMAFIRIAGLNRVGVKTQLLTAALLPAAIRSAWFILRKFRAQAVFSMGGFVAGPVMLAAALARIPLVIMEPNAAPGFANRRMARRAARVLLGFAGGVPWSPANRTEVTGLPVRAGFFQVAAQPKQTGLFTLLITGGSRGARTLNRAARESWPLFRAAGTPIKIIHQTGAHEHAALAREFTAFGLSGEVVPFIEDMAAAFAQSDLVLGRAGAGGVSEIAAAQMPSILIPLPFAADDHQRKNAEALVRANAARLILDKDLSGERLFEEVQSLIRNPQSLQTMRENVQPFAKPNAATRSADILEQLAAQAH